MTRTVAEWETAARKGGGGQKASVSPRTAEDASPIIAQMLQLLLDACGQQSHDLERAEVVVMAGPDWRTHDEAAVRRRVRGRMIVEAVNRSVVLEAMGRGISAFVTFDDEPEHLMEAARQAAIGGSYLSPQIQRRMEILPVEDVEAPMRGIEAPVDDGKGQERAARGGSEADGLAQREGPLALLSLREREVAALLAEGYSQKEIREQLFISSRRSIAMLRRFGKSSSSAAAPIFDIPCGMRWAHRGGERPRDADV